MSKMRSKTSDNYRNNPGGTRSVGGNKTLNTTGRAIESGRTRESRAQCYPLCLGGSKRPVEAGRISNPGKVSVQRPVSESASRARSKSKGISGSERKIRVQSVQRSRSISQSETESTLMRDAGEKKYSDVNRGSDVESRNEFSKESGVKRVCENKNVCEAKGKSEVMTRNEVRAGNEARGKCSSRAGTEVRGKSNVRAGNEVSEKINVRAENDVREKCSVKAGNEVRQKYDVRAGNEVREKCNVREENEVREKYDVRAGNDVREKCTVRAGNVVREKCNVRAGNEVREKYDAMAGNEVRGKCNSGAGNEVCRKCVATGDELSCNVISKMQEVRTTYCDLQKSLEITQVYDIVNPPGCSNFQQDSRECEELMHERRLPKAGITCRDNDEDPRRGDACTRNVDGSVGGLILKHINELQITEENEPYYKVRDGRATETETARKTFKTLKTVDMSSVSYSSEAGTETSPACKCDVKPGRKSVENTDKDSNDTPNKPLLRCKCPPNTRATSCKSCTPGPITTECCNKCMVALGKRLLRASQDGKCSEVRKLLDDGADPNFTFESEWTPLHRAAAKAFPDVVAELIKSGANVNAKIGGFSALHLASYNDRTGRCVFQLINAGADLETTNKFGRTPLHYASESANVSAVRELLAAGAVRTVKDKRGWTPIDVGKTAEIRRILHQLP